MNGLLISLLLATIAAIGVIAFATIKSIIKNTADTKSTTIPTTTPTS